LHSGLQLYKVVHMAAISFDLVVSKVYDCWDVLAYAFMNRLGGQHTAEKLQWLKSVTLDYFRDNRNLEPWELEDWLATILDTEFDLFVEDGSIDRICTQICTAYNNLQNGNQADVCRFLNELPSAGAVHSRVADQSHAADESSDSDDSMGETDGCSSVKPGSSNGIPSGDRLPDMNHVAFFASAERTLAGDGAQASATAIESVGRDAALTASKASSGGVAVVETLMSQGLTLKSPCSEQAVVRSDGGLTMEVDSVALPCEEQDGWIPVRGRRRKCR
jgi:hypothetical protein